MATNNLFNVPSWTSIQELFYRRLGIDLNPDLVSYTFTPSAVEALTNQLLATGTGSQNRYVITVNGLTPLSIANMTLVREDWDGTWTLSRIPHSNSLLYSDDLSQQSAWYQYASTVGSSTELYGGVVPYWEIFAPTAYGAWDTGVVQMNGPTAQPNDVWTAVIAFRATANNSAAMLGMASPTNYVYLNPQSYGILQGPGELSYTGVSGAFPGGNGSCLMVSGLSTTEDTLVYMTVVNDGTAAGPVNVSALVGSVSTYNQNTSVLATRVSLNKGAALPYISNGATVNTQADYTLMGPTVTLTNDLAEGGTLTWSGNATLPPVITVTANATAPDGSQAPYSGSLSYPLSQLQVSQELPAILVWSDLFPMTVQNLADYLLSNYGYYLEDGEFYVSGDPNQTPLARANTGTIYDGLNVQTQQFSLVATGNAIRWNAGSSILFQVASSNSIVPSDGFSITSAAPPAGTLGSAYSYTYTVTGGTPPYTYVVIEGTPVATVSPSTGVMSSTDLPTIGTFSWIIQVTDSVGRIVTRQDQVTVSEAPLTMSPTTLNPSVSVGVPVNIPFNVSGGLPPYTYSVYLGSLPPFVSLENGALEGVFEGSISQTSVTTPIGIQVTDSQNNTIQRIFSITVSDRASSAIQASLCEKVLHWFECQSALYSDNLSPGDVLYDATGRANMEVEGLPGYGSPQIVLEGGPGVQSSFGFGNGAYAQNNTTAYNLTGNFAIMALVCPLSGVSTGQALVSRGGDANGGYELQVGSSAITLDLDVNLSGSVDSVQFPSTLPVGQGNFYFTITQFYDGIPEQEINAGASSLMSPLTGTPMANNTDALFLGIHPQLASSSAFHGNLGMVGIFTDKLWSDERKWLYNSGELQTFSSLGYFPTLTMTPNGTIPTTLVLGEAVSFSYTVAGGSGTYINAGTLAGFEMPPGLTVTFDGHETVTVSGEPTQLGGFTSYLLVASTDGQSAARALNLSVVYSGATLINLPMTGANGATSVTDTAGNTWTLHGNAEVSTAVAVNGAMYFDGTDSYLSTPLTSAFNFTNVPYTVSLDVYPQLASAFMLSTTFGTEMPLLMGLDGDSGNPGSSSGLYPYMGWYATGTWNAARSAMAANQNAWNTITGYYNTLTNQIAVFLNGQVMGFATPSEEQAAPSGGSIMLGCDWNNANFFRGYMRNLIVETGLTYKTLSIQAGTYLEAPINAAYSQGQPIYGGSGTYSNLEVTSGALPPGMSVSLGLNTVILSGTPTASGSYSFTVSLQSSDGQTASASQSITVGTAFPTLTITGNYAGGSTGIAYSSALTIAGGSGVYNAPTLESGTLPPGTALSISGDSLLLTGTPTTLGSYSFVVGVSSSDGQAALSTVQSVAISASGAALASTIEGLAPTAYWLLNETEGPTAADVMGNYPATYANSDITYGNPALIGGTGTCITSSGGIPIASTNGANSTALNSTTTLSFVALIETGSSSTSWENNSICGMGNNEVFNGQGIAFGLNANGQLCIQFWDDQPANAGYYAVTDNTAMEPSTIALVGFTVSTVGGSTTTSLYLNGTQVGTGTIAYPYIAPGGTFSFDLGGKPSSNSFAGSMSNAALWAGVALTAEQHQQIAEAAGL
jgi:hypothetical protein